MEHGGSVSRQGFQAEEHLKLILSRFAHTIAVTDNGTGLTAQFPGLGSLNFQLCFVSDGTPAAIRRWILNRARPSPLESYLVVSAPYLSGRAMDECEAADVGALDLAGNYRLAFGTYRLERVGHAPPPQIKREQQNVYMGKTLQVVRAFLAAPDRPWQVQELAHACEVSLGTVSGVRQKLLTQGWLEHHSDGAVVTDAAGLLREWAEWNKPPSYPSISAYSLLNSTRLTEALRSLDEPKVLLGGSSAAEWMAPFLTAKGLQLYTDPTTWRKTAKHLQAEEVEKGGNLTVQFVKDDGMFLDRIELKPGLWTASPAQTFVDLWRQGSRSREAAEKLLRDYLMPVWKGETLYSSWPLRERRNNR